MQRGIEVHLPRGHTFRMRHDTQWWMCFGVHGERNYPASSLRSLRTVDSECVFEFIDEVEPIALNNPKTLNRFVGLLRQWLESQSVRCSHTDFL